MGRETAQAAAGTQGGGGGALDERGAGVPTTSAPGRASGSAMSKPTSQGSCDRSGRLKPSWWHDAFNVAALGVINSANCWYLLYGTGFRFFWWSTVLYFLADFAWIAACPHCVKSPGVLAGHHLVAAAYTLLPFFYPSTASKMSFVMTVEVNTWLLIARRMISSAVLDALFYTTWFIIRTAWFPCDAPTRFFSALYLIYDFYLEYRRAADESGNALHPIILAPVVQIALCVLNMQWTVQLVKSKLLRTDKTHTL